MKRHDLYNELRFNIYKEDLSKKLPPSNATIREEYVKCGNILCCEQGEDGYAKHGPYFYAYWKDPTTKKLKKRYIGRSVEDFETKALAKYVFFQKKQEYKKRQLLEELAREGESQFPTLVGPHRRWAKWALKTASRYGIDYVFEKVKFRIEYDVSTYSGYKDKDGNVVKFGDYSDILQALSSIKHKWKHRYGYEESKIDELQHELKNKKSNDIDESI